MVVFRQHFDSNAHTEVPTPLWDKVVIIFPLRPYQEIFATRVLLRHRSHRAATVVCK
jgi:hypothetical protein